MLCQMEIKKTDYKTLIESCIIKLRLEKQFMERLSAPASIKYSHRENEYDVLCELKPWHTSVVYPIFMNITRIEAHTHTNLNANTQRLKCCRPVLSDQICWYVLQEPLEKEHFPS